MTDDTCNGVTRDTWRDGVPSAVNPLGLTREGQRPGAIRVCAVEPTASNPLGLSENDLSALRQFNQRDQPGAMVGGATSIGSTIAGAGRADQTQVGGTHYKDMPMQPWDVMQAVMSREEFIGFLKGNIIKYSMRAGQKAGASDDGEKARHYRQKLREVQ